MDKINFTDLIPSNIKEIIETLTENNFPAYIVGGACREFLLGNYSEIHDFDIVTKATPQEIKELFPKVTTCGNSFLVSLVNGIEVATTRADKKDGAEQSFSFFTDSERRDFTVNSILYDIKKDYFHNMNNGVDDINSRIIKFIGNPERRILEDPIRMLRCLRFAAQDSLEIDTESYFAIYKNRQLLQDLPGERLRLEVQKAFSTSSTHRFLVLLEELEILPLVFPHLPLLNINGGKYHNEKVLHHCFNAVKALDKTKKVNLKLAALYHDIGKYRVLYNDKGEIIFKDHCKQGLDYLQDDLANHLKFDNATVSYVRHMANWHMDCIESKRSIRRLLVKLSSANISIKDFLFLRYSDDKGCMKNYTSFKDTKVVYKEILKIINEKPPFNVKSLDINGNILMNKFNLQPSKKIGELLNKAFEEVTEGNLQNKEEDLLTFISNLLEVEKWRV